MPGVVMYEECSYQIALCIRGKKLPGAYMSELRQLEDGAQLVSTKRMVKAKIAEALGPEDTEEAIRF